MLANEAHLERQAHSLREMGLSVSPGMGGLAKTLAFAPEAATLHNTTTTLSSGWLGPLLPVEPKKTIRFDPRAAEEIKTVGNRWMGASLLRAPGQRPPAPPASANAAAGTGSPGGRTSLELSAKDLASPRPIVKKWTFINTVALADQSKRRKIHS
jgi:hypothetical protein